MAGTLYGVPKGRIVAPHTKHPWRYGCPYAGCCTEYKQASYRQATDILVRAGNAYRTVLQSLTAS